MKEKKLWININFGTYKICKNNINSPPNEFANARNF